jgi:hypothetical protein
MSMTLTSSFLSDHYNLVDMIIYNETEWPARK